MPSSSEGSAPAAVLPTSSDASASAGSTCSAPPTPPAAGDAMLVSKVLTHSDVSIEVARTGRIVLPRIQVQQCLPQLLRLCGAEHALGAARAGGPVKLSVDLAVEDEAGRTWVLLMKTWQNVVGGEHRPTFVLENTADFVRANRLAQGDTLALCPHHGRMLLRTSLRADQLLPRTLKRAAGSAAAGPAAKRRAPPAQPAPAPGRATPEPVLASGGHARRAACATQPGAFWQPGARHAADAAEALLFMHSAGSSQQDSGASDSEHVPLSSGVTPAPPRSPASHPSQPASHPAVLRPTPLHCGQLAQAPRRQQAPRELLPPAPPLCAAGLSGAGPPALALVQARAWLAAILAQQERERRWLEQYNRALLLRALQQAQARHVAGLHA